MLVFSLEAVFVAQFMSPYLALLGGYLAPKRCSSLMLVPSLPLQLPMQLEHLNLSQFVGEYWWV